MANSTIKNVLGIIKFDLNSVSGWTVNAHGKKCGHIVVLQGILKPPATLSNARSFELSEVIPASYCPIDSTDFAAFDNSSDTSIHGIAYADAHIRLWRPESTNLVEIRFSATYIVAN